MIQIPNYLEKLDDNISICNVSSFLEESRKKARLTYADISRLTGFWQDHYRQRLKKSSFTIKFLKDFQRQVDSTIFEKIYASPDLILTARTRKVRLPTIVTKDLAYFFGYLQGDGCLTSDKKGICFADEYFDQIEKINCLSETMF